METRPSPETAPILKKISRRQFLGLAGVTVAGLAAATSTYLYFNNEADQLDVEQVQLPVANLHPALEGFTIAQISDIHLEPFTKIELVQRAVALTNSLNPDLIVLTGDYVWKKEEAVFDLTPVLAQLNAPHGVISIAGNHDLWTDFDLIASAFAQERLPLLVNQGLPISVGKGSLYLAGLDDGWSGNPSLRDALVNYSGNSPIILLLHEPDLADDYATDARIVLQLAGHSHGGQIRLPRLGPLLLPYLGWKYDQGLYRVKNMWLYTNRGLGVTNEPVRFNCSPEITHITLVRA